MGWARRGGAGRGGRLGTVGVLVGGGFWGGIWGGFWGGFGGWAGGGAGRSGVRNQDPGPGGTADRGDHRAWGGRGREMAKKGSKTGFSPKTPKNPKNGQKRPKNPQKRGFSITSKVEEFRQKTRWI